MKSKMKAIGSFDLFQSSFLNVLRTGVYSQLMKKKTTLKKLITRRRMQDASFIPQPAYHWFCPPVSPLKKSVQLNSPGW